MRYYIIFLLLLMSFQDVKAQWSPSARETIREASKKYQVQGPPGYVSLWGGIKRKWKGGSVKGDIREYYAKNYFKKETLPIYFYEGEEPGPLSIFFPGIFGKHDGDLSPGIIELLESQKGHVVVIPNFLSDVYIKSEPLYSKDVTQTDIKAIADILSKVLMSIPEQKINRINLIGESLGTIVASGVLKELSNKSNLSKMKFNLLLFWPPLKLKSVLTNFDKEFKDSFKIYNECSFWYRYPSIFYHFIIQDVPKNTSKNFRKCMNSYLYHGVFKVGIKNSIEAAMEVKGIKMKKAPENFEEYFKMYNENFYNMIKNEDEKLNLSYWLNKRRMNKTTVRIISSKDDFINKGINWDNFLSEASLTKENLILLPWGAHSGGLAMDIWPSIINKEILFTRKRVKWGF